MLWSFYLKGSKLAQIFVFWEQHAFKIWKQMFDEYKIGSVNQLL